MPIGTIVNTIAVIVGSLIGVMLHKNFPDRVKAIVFQGIGLATLVLGMQMAFEVQNLLILIFSILIGGIIGEVINVEMYFERFADWLKRKVKIKDDKFSDGFITATLIYCIGSMAVIGSLNEGLRGDRTLLFTKSILDGFTSVALASTYGIGVLFSAIPLLIYQGGLTVMARYFQSLFSDVILAELTAVGGVLILGIGINLLEIKKVKLMNLLPALLVVVLLTSIFG